MSAGIGAPDRMHCEICGATITGGQPAHTVLSRSEVIACDACSEGRPITSSARSIA